jgi:hypothetical protein
VLEPGTVQLVVLNSKVLQFAEQWLADLVATLSRTQRLKELQPATLFVVAFSADARWWFRIIHNTREQLPL